MLHRTGLSIPAARPDRRGAVSKGCLIGGGIVAALALLVLVVVGVVVSTRNQLVGGRETVAAKWSEIDNQYKRRYDLVPNLVATVKGAAEFEKSTLQAVTDARASVGRAQIPGNVPTDPAQLRAYIEAQQGLSGALGRLFAVAENYPQLRATESFRDLQVQIEGTENRIVVARRDYIDAVRAYNTRVKSFPANVIAGMFGFEPAPQLEIPAEERATPKVDFGTPSETEKK